MPPPLPVYVPSSEMGPPVSESDEDPDLDRAVKYILISPPTTDKLTKREWQNTVSGIIDIETISALDSLIEAQSGSMLSALLSTSSSEDGPKRTIEQSNASDHLQVAHNWNSIGTSLIPGYSALFDGYNLRALCDENYKTRPELMSNRNAGLLFMQPEGVCHGNVIVWCSIDNRNNNEIDSAVSGGSHPPDNKSSPDTAVHITRRNILQTIEYNLECGFANSVPDRVHFENITKKAALGVFKKENFTMIDG